MRPSLALILTLSALPLTVSGHHSGAVVYDPAQTTQIEGEVVRVFWRNPHVHFLIKVTDSSGREAQWDVESNSVSILSRMGVSPDVVKVGERVTVAGWPARRHVDEMFATNMLLADGREVLLNPSAPPRWSDETLGTSAAWVSDGEAVDAETGDRGVFRVWSTNMANPESFPLFNDVLAIEENYPLTDAASAARESFDPVEDNPFLSCAPMGMPRVMGQPYPIEFIDRGDEILLRIELYDIERRILMTGDRRRAEDVPASPLGHSVGRWEGRALVVTTTRVNWPYFDQSGVPLSADAEIVERFEPSSDGSRLDYTITVRDPATFTEPVTLRKYWTWRPDERIQPFDCVEFEDAR